MYKFILITSLSLIAAQAIEFKDKNIDGYIPPKECKELIIKNSTITNSLLDCDNVFIENSVLKGTTTYAKHSMVLKNNKISDTKSNKHLINCIDCQEYMIIKNTITNIEAPSLSYNFGNTSIVKDNIIHDNHVTNALFANVNNETMYDIYNGNKASEIKKPFKKQYDEDLKNGLFNVSEYENNYALFSNNKIYNNTGRYGVYGIRTWDYFTKNSYMPEISVQEALFGASYQRGLMSLILPYFISFENNEFHNNHFSDFTVAGENILSYNSKFNGNIFFSETMQGYNNTFLDGFFYTGMNQIMVHSQFNFKIKNKLLNSVAINYRTLNDNDVFFQNSIVNTPVNGINNIFEKDTNKIYEMLQNSKGCGINPFEELSIEFFKYTFPNFKANTKINYIGRKSEIVKDTQCPYYETMYANKFAERHVYKPTFEEGFEEKKEDSKTYTFDTIKEEPKSFDTLKSKEEPKPTPVIKKEPANAFSFEDIKIKPKQEEPKPIKKEEPKKFDF